MFLDNVFFGKFFRLLKSELLHLQEFKSREHFQQELETYIFFTITN
ncbi:IS3 family transposase [Priestia megaterium]